MPQYFNLNNYDVVFLSYDEPNREPNWENVKEKIPKALRIHGIKGSDTAHKECARITTTERIIIIDGDNWIWEDYLNQTVVLDDSIDASKTVFSWPAKNEINGLMYGNGGIKCWPRQAILDMKTHENADPANVMAQVDFCWELTYLSTGYPRSSIVNYTSKKQAWRAGFREGVKMLLESGVKTTDINSINKGNLDRLKIWMTTGLDIENGVWAILGSRQGCNLILNHPEWDYTQVRDFDWLDDFFNTSIADLSESEGFDEIKRLEEKISKKMFLSEPFSAQQSKFIKEFNIGKTQKSKGISWHKNHIYDIVMITYHEPNAESNYMKLKERFPSLKRIDGVKGIHQAHIAAAKICKSDMFWIVDGDAEIIPEFNFSFHLPQPDDTVRVWRCKNPINDLIYGYGGVKLFPRQRTIDMDISKPDMTTSISSNYIPVMELSNITVYNTDPFNTWKSAFRECCKLASSIIDRQKDEETKKRLEIWRTVGSDRLFGQYAIDGANAGSEYGSVNKENVDALRKINDFDWLKNEYELRYNSKTSF